MKNMNGFSESEQDKPSTLLELVRFYQEKGYTENFSRTDNGQWQCNGKEVDDVRIDRTEVLFDDYDDVRLQLICLSSEQFAMKGLIIRTT